MSEPVSSEPVLHQPVSQPAPGTRLTPWIVVAMLAMIVIPATITFNTVRVPAKLDIANPNPTPHGYTWSLLLFIVPIVVIAFWFIPQEHLNLPKRAFWRSIGVLVPFGFGLDFFLASRLFIFPNPGATLKIAAPALGKPVPIEEYVFYLTGFIAVLLIYVWLDEFWLAAYNVPDYRGEGKMIARLLRFHPSSAIFGVVVIAVAVIYKKMFSTAPEGFPLYFTLLVAIGLVPSASFLLTVRRFINWRAFSLTLFFVLLVSLLWEATLAIPYGWWGYQPRQMMGLSIGAWFGLPIEAVCVWIAVTYATVIVFEVVKLWQASEKSAKDAFLGKTSPPNPRRTT
jgi:hypothetical protein